MKVLDTNDFSFFVASSFIPNFISNVMFSNVVLCTKTHHLPSDVIDTTDDVMLQSLRNLSAACSYSTIKNSMGQRSSIPFENSFCMIRGDGSM